MQNSRLPDLVLILFLNPLREDGTEVAAENSLMELRAVLAAERRRIWRDEDKLEIVTSVGVGGASVTQIAQRHEIKASRL